MTMDDENNDWYYDVISRGDPNVPFALPDASKRRVQKTTAELTGNRCLIENTDEANAVGYVHCLARDASSDLVGFVLS
jgi:hypothetical protein